MQFEVNNAGVSQRLTLAQMFALSMAAVTVDTPLLNMAQTWNAGAVTFTGWKLNVTDTASAAASRLLDLQVGGVSKFNVSKAGLLSLAGGSKTAVALNFGTANTGWYGSSGGTTPGFGLSVAGTAYVYTSSSGDGFRIHGNWGYCWTAADAEGTADLVLRRDAANVLAQRNGTNTQECRLYETYTDAANYRRLNFRFSAGDCFIETDAAGTGVAGQGQLMLKTSTGKQIRFYIGATQAWQMNSSGHFVAGADNTYDIGASGATRPRNLYLAGGLTHGATTLLSTTTSLANGADDQTVTINNGPVSGDPTKWIPINDNGTTRYIPAW